jgi:predicted esterase
MKPFRLLLSAAVLGTAAGWLPAQAQDYTPPPSQPPDAATLKTIAERSDRLAHALRSLRDRGVPEALRADIEVYHKAAEWITRHDEFYQKEYAAWTLEALDHGLLRVALLARGDAPWLQEAGHSVVHGYRSAVDGSVQPYAVTFPADYGKDPRRKWRLDIVLHGRDKGLTEVKFLHQHNGEHEAPKDQDWVQLDLYGRGNNAYRWAGERDVVEAGDAFVAMERQLGTQQLLDPDRVVLRGFSMGGAGTWHIGLHHPDQWCVIGPGAGFTSTHGYIKDLPEPLPPYQEACLHIYDAVDYAENAADVPVVAYAGSDDPQLQAARTIEAKLKGFDIPITVLVAPGLKHQFPPEWQKKAEAEYARFVERGRPHYPAHVRFVTYTLKYAACYWAEALALERHYERSLIDAEQTDTGYKVKTANVRGLHIQLPPGASRQPLSVTVDGTQLETRPYLRPDGTLHLYLSKQGGAWSPALPERLNTERLRRPQKVRNLQGPIDDAFMSPFLCVRGTGKPWHEAAQRYADAALKRFQAEWSRSFRGELPVKDDVDVTAEDIAGKSLVLFGDPGSNPLIEQALPGLPLRWTKDDLSLAGHAGSAAADVPALIYPSPLNPGRYVVLNSGHTFHARDFEGTNALLYPRLGDYALLKPAPTDKDPGNAEVVAAGLFDESWQPGERK